MANAIIVPPLGFASIDANSTVLGSPAYMGNDYAGVIWRGEGVSAHNILVDLGYDQPVDTIMMLGCFTSGTSPLIYVSLATSAQGPFTGASWTSPEQSFAAGAVPARSGIIGVLITSGAPPVARYLSIVVRNGFPWRFEVSRLVVGKSIRLERNFGYGASFGVRDLGNLDFSARGVLLRRRGAKLRTVGLTFSNVRKDEVEGQVQPLLERVGNTDMVAMITDPAPDAQRQTRCYYGPLVGDLGTARRNAAAWEAKCNLVSIF